MKQSKFLKILAFALPLLWSTVNAQELYKEEQSAKAAEEIPELQEWWRAPFVEQEGYLGEGVTFLPNFYNGKNAMALRTPGGVHTWLNRFPGDTQNFFTWKAGYIKRGDFNGDGITDYIDANGNIYRGIQNGQPPESEPVKNYGINGQVFDVNNDGYDDVYNFNFSGSVVLYGGPDLTNLQATDKFQRPSRDKDYGGMNAFYKTPQGEFRIVFHTMKGDPEKKDSLDGYILYRASWEKGSMTPTFEALDSIIRLLDFQHTSYFDGIGGVYQSRHHDKTFLFNNETIYNDSFKKNAVFYDVSNDKFTEHLRFQIYNADFTLLEHSIDGDQYEDIAFITGLGEISILRGGINLDSVFSFKTGCPGINSGLQTINDVSGDGINDAVLIGKRLDESCFAIVKGKDISVGTNTSQEESVFSLDIPQPQPIQQNQTSTVSFSISQPTHYTLSLYSIRGEHIAEIFKDYIEKGKYTKPLNVAQYKISSGSYVLRLSNGIQSVERTIIITN